MTFTKQQIKSVINACNQRDIENVYVESHFENGKEISQIRVHFYSGSDQGIMYDVNKEDAEALITKIYQIKENNLMEKYNVLFED